MKHPFFIRAFKPVRPEEIPLRDNQILRKPLAMQCVHIHQ